MKNSPGAIPIRRTSAANSKFASLNRPEVSPPAPFLPYFHLAAMTITATRNSAVNTSIVILLSKWDMSAGRKVCFCEQH